VTRFVAAILIAHLAAAAAAATAPPAVKSITIGGREYLALEEWGRSRGLQLVWASKTDLLLTNKATRLNFTVNSPKAALNGTTLWLTCPVVLQGATPCLARADVQTTFEPLLWPVQRGPKSPLICVDAGHGGKDTGNLEGRHKEKDYTLLLAREFAAQLRKAGFRTTLTRSWDTTVELEDRPEIARRRGAHLFISLHLNAAANGDARGSEVYCLTPAFAASTNARGEGAGTGALAGNQQNGQNILLAYHLQRSVVRRMGLEDRGVRRARWAVLRTARMPAVLVEVGFMSNPDEARRLYSPEWRRQYCQALVEGVKNYQRLASGASAPPAP